MWKSIFEGIQTLFVDFLFLPLDFLRKLELSSWLGANLINWVFIIICISYLIHVHKEIRRYKKNGEDEQDTTAHSFLK